MFRNTRNGAWYFHLFQSLFQFCFETNETFGLSQFSSCFSPFQFFPYIIHCFSVSKHQKWGLVFSPFPELVSILFWNVSKQLKHLDLVNFLHVSVHFLHFSVRFNFFPYISHCFSISKHQKWDLVFSPFPESCFILFRNISKQLKHSDLANFLHVSVCFKTSETIEPFGLSNSSEVYFSI